MVKIKKYTLFFFIFIMLSAFVYSSDYLNFLTYSIADTRYCLFNATCYFQSLTVTNMTVINSTVTNYNITNSITLRDKTITSWDNISFFNRTGTVVSNAYAKDNLSWTGSFLLQDSGNTILTFENYTAGSARFRWKYGSTLVEQEVGVGGASVSRMIYQPNGDRYDVLNEAGTLFSLTVTPLYQMITNNVAAGTNATVLGLTVNYGSNSDQKSICWYSGSTIVGCIDTRYDGTGVNMGFGHLYNNGAAKTDDAMLIKGNGNVGIGTSNPNSILHVKKDQNAGTILNIENAQGGTGAYTYLRLAEDYTSKFLALFHINRNYTASGIFVANTSYIDSGDTGGLGIGARNAVGSIFFYTGGTATSNERMKIDKDGNVGIGTSTPAQKLEVNGNINQLSGNTTINEFYAGMYASSETGLIGMTLNQSYKIINFTNADSLNGFKFLDNNKLSLTNAQGVGKYWVDWHTEKDATNNHIYFAKVFVNEIEYNITIDRSVGQASNAMRLTGFGYINISSINDNVTLRIKDSSGTSTPNVYIKNIILRRVGSLT